MKRFFFILFLSLFSVSLFAQEKMTGDQYIAAHKDLAIVEMRRTGIPASITLAQGLLESGNGNSRLAREANNHFGIKCKSDWKGRSVKADDDAPQECFRAYDKVEESYRDHSDFLVNGPRYAFLFELDPYDYKEWAKGLRQAGYATNPKYADLLISAVERYQLDQYDKQAGRIAKNHKENKEEQKEVTAPASVAFKYNNIQAYVVKPGDTYNSIADDLHLMRWQVRKYNDLEKTDDLKPGTILYLKPKRNKSKEDYHIVQEGESMYYISQSHAIKLKKLYKWNRMDEGQEPMAGEKLNLRRKRDHAPKLQNEPKFAGRQGIMQGKPAPAPKAKTAGLLMVPAGEADFSTADAIKKDTNEAEDTLEAAFVKPVKKAPVERPPYHVVQQGETIYSIAGKYALVEQDLRQWNKLEGDKLSQGQKLMLKKPQADSLPPVNPSGMVVAVKPVQQAPVEIKAIDTLSSPAPVTKQTPAKTKPAATTGTVAKTNETTHTVVAGETLYSISRKTGVQLDSLMQWNGLKEYTLSTGQVLKLQGAGQNFAEKPAETYHEVQAGETLYSIARRYQLTVDQLKTINEMTDNSLSPGQKLKIANP